MKLLDYSGLQRFLNKIKTLLDSKSNTGHTHTVSDVSGLSTVATSGDYGDLSNTPTIPTVNNATLTIQKNGTTVKTFTANASSNVTANITVPTNVSELTNDSGFLTSSSNLDSSKLTGTIDIARLPKGALERLVTVTDQTARFALTASDVQLGDTVKQLDTGVMYIVTDESKLNSADGYTEYTAGSATSVPWSGVTGKPSSYTPASHTHGNIANGGTLGTASRALITDGNKKITTSSVTSTELGYVSGVTSAIQTQLNGKASSSHTHTASEVSGLSTVATTGSYTDLNNIPSNFTPASHTHGSITNDGKLGTASRALVTDSSKKIAVSSVTSTELGYLSGVTSAVQTQLNGKSNTGHTHVTSEVTDLLNSQHTWSAQQSYSADLNLNYTSTDVDDILDTVAGSYTAEDFLAQNNVWTGSNKYSQNLNITNSGWEQGVTPASLASRYIQFLDKNNNSSGAVGFHQDSTGSSFLNILAGDKYDNGAKSTSGSLIRNQFRIGTTETGLKYQNIEGSWNCNLTPLTNNTYDLGSFSNQWSNVYANEVKTTLVDPYTNTTLVVRSTDNTWDNGARMFLYSNSYLSQGYGLFYLDVDHGDNNHTKTAVTLAPNSFHPQGGTVNTTYGVSLGTPTAQWAKVYAEKYYYYGTQWGLDQANTWTGSNKFKSSNTNFGLQSTVAEAGSLTASSNWMYWLDKNGYQDAYISRDFWNDGSDSLRISISGKRANGAPSTSGTAVECGIRLDIAANGTKSLKPFVSNDTDLGSSALQWNSIFGKTYYYNGTAWGLDQNNTWTGANNFSILSLFSNSVTYNQAPSSNVELPSIRIFGGGKYCGAFDYVWSSTGENVIRLSLASYRSDGSFGYWACNFGVPRDFSNGGNFGTPAFYPNNNKGYNLGTSNNQWAGIYGTTIYENGTALSSKYVKVESGYAIGTHVFARIQVKNFPTGTGSSQSIQYGNEVDGSKIESVEFEISTTNALEYTAGGSLSGKWEYLGKTHYAISYALTSQYIYAMFRRKS